MGGLISAVVLGQLVASSPTGSWRKVLKENGVTDQRINEVMETVRRRDFLPEPTREAEFEDRPLVIGHGQTTSQPSLIARMIQELGLKPGCKVLEVGTGSGYQTALLARLCREVYSIDIVEPLALAAKERLKALGYLNAQVRAGDGYLGWKEAAPFDGIVVCAEAPKVPLPLIEQLKVGGRLVIPVEGKDGTRLRIYEKAASGQLTEKAGLDVRFVPLTGANAERDRQRDQPQ